MILYIVKYSVTQGKILHQDLLEMKEIGDEHVIMQNRKNVKSHYTPISLLFPSSCISREDCSLLVLLSLQCTYYNTYMVRIMKQIYKLKWRTLYVSIYFIVSA